MMTPFDGTLHFGENDRFAVQCKHVPIGVVGITFVLVYDRQRLDREGLPLLVFIKDIRCMESLSLDLEELTSVGQREPAG